MIIKGNQNHLNLKTKNFYPFEDSICKFIIELSKDLKKIFSSREHPDILTFAFFCREANIKKIKESFFLKKEIKKSLGLIFHVPPNNIATNFAYSLIFSLLSTPQLQFYHHN